MVNEQENRISKTSDFALGTLTQAKSPYLMDLNQAKIYAYAISLISPKDNPDERQTYRIHVDTLAQMMADHKSKASLMRNLEASADKLFLDSPAIKYKQGDKTERFRILDKLTTYDNGHYIDITFQQDFRRILILMKSEYDVIYPLSTILSFRCKYSVALYNFLLARASELRQGNTKTSGRYTITSTPEELMNFFSFTANTNILGKFHKQALLPACRDLNEHSEIYIENEQPVFIKKGKKIIGYEFSILIKVNVANPIFASLSSPQKTSSDIPPLSYTLRKLLDIGVNDAFVKYVGKDKDPRKAWHTFLYSVYHTKNDKAILPQYYNKAYKLNYALSCEDDIEMYFMTIYDAFPEYDDDVMFRIHSYYTEEAVKPMEKDYHKSKSSDEIRQLLQGFRNRRNEKD